MSDAKPEITVELYGVPRRRAGRGALSVRAGRVADLLAALDDACPELHCLIDPVLRLNPQYLLSLNGQRFVTDLDAALHGGDRVLLLSADAGG